MESNGTALRADAMRVIGSGVDCLKDSIRCSIDTEHPLDLDTLKLALSIESKGSGGRVTMVRMLEREIRRQMSLRSVSA